MRTCRLFIYVGLLAAAGAGQVTFLKMPKSLQLYARNPANDSAVVAIEGSVRKPGANYQEVRLKVFRSGIARTTLTRPLTFNPDTASFSFSPAIKAELANYRFEVYGYNGTQEVVLRAADSVVAGDVFIITGQSNAVAGGTGTSGAINESTFIRVFGRTFCQIGVDTLWHIGVSDANEVTPGNVGQWGTRMARLIIDSQKIPVGIFNGGNGGVGIWYFPRNDAKPADTATNYGKLLTRVIGAGLTNGIKALFWFQGEADAGTVVDNYMASFQKLTTGWRTDYPGLEKTYIFQIRNGCNLTADAILNVKEAHRRLAKLEKNSIMSTSGQNHSADNCHYAYDDGYKLFGDNIYRLVARDFYGVTGDNIEPPSVKFAETANSGLVVKLIMENIMDSLTWYSGSQADFKLDGTSIVVINGSVTGFTVRLAVGGNAGTATGISYLGHQNTPEPMVSNLNGVGTVHFKNFPFTTPRYRDSTSTIAILSANALALRLDSVTTSGSSLRVTELRLAGKRIRTMPKDIAYMDSLRTVDLSGNLLTTLPPEFTKLPASVVINVNYNYLCTVMDPVKTWLNSHSVDPQWQSKQLRDSTHYCDGSLTPVREELKFAGRSADFGIGFKRTGRSQLTITFPSRAQTGLVRIFRTNGTLAASIAAVSPVSILDLADFPKGAYLFQISTATATIVIKIICFEGR